MLSRQRRQIAIENCKQTFLAPRSTATYCESTLSNTIVPLRGENHFAELISIAITPLRGDKTKIRKYLINHLFHFFNYLKINEY